MLQTEEMKNLAVRNEEIEKKIDELYANTPREQWTHQWWLTNIDPLNEEKKKNEEKIITLKAENIEVGDYISISPYTDWTSYKVIARTAKTLTCQMNRSTHFKVSWTDGELEAEDDPNGSIITLHWSNKKNWWSYGKYHRVALGKRDYRDPSF